MADNEVGSSAQRLRPSRRDRIKKMEKELYREALMRDYGFESGGSKYPRQCLLSPFPYERRRCSRQLHRWRTGPCRKQWLQDQILTDSGAGTRGGAGCAGTYSERKSGMRHSTRSGPRADAPHRPCRCQPHYGIRRFAAAVKLVAGLAAIYAPLSGT
uniref:Uncharacterized protein n=1 Tax=Macrostomum lignano TaxID=282301 RepID=A0A1I8FR43_9PLAT